MIAGLLDHIWQSTLFAGGIAVLTLFFRRNRASLRFWLWFAASLKFLVPFAVLAMLGTYLSHLFAASIPPSILAMRPAAEKLSEPARLLVHAQNIGPALLLLGGWMAGFAGLLGLRLLHWTRLRRLTQTAQDFSMAAPARISVRIKTSAALLEPGLVGIFAPIVLLPDGLMSRLSDPERDSILAHEFSHLRRRDNVTAAIHMAVETLFWFCPPVWFIGARLIAERERACDESVLAAGHDPEVYAGGILKVCKFCIQSPLACASGISGSDLKNRVRQIMSGEAVLGLGHAQRLLLAGAAALALMLPVMAGFQASPLALEVQKKAAAVRFQVVAGFTRNVAAVEERAGFMPAAHVSIKRLPRLKMVQVAAAVLPPEPPVPPAPSPLADASAPSPVGQAAPVPGPAMKEMAMALDPRGAGDPDGIICRAPQPLPGSRLPGPQVCKANRLWAQLRARHQEISPDGHQVIALDATERYRTVNSLNCARLLGMVSGSTSTPASLPLNFCF